MREQQEFEEELAQAKKEREDRNSRLEQEAFEQMEQQLRDNVSLSNVEQRAWYIFLQLAWSVVYIL